MKNNPILKIACGTLIVLLIPLIAMLFTDQVNWGIFDFVIMGTLIFSIWMAYEIISKKVNKKNRVFVAIFSAFALLVLWSELAVGIFGSPFAGS